MDENNTFVAGDQKGDVGRPGVEINLRLFMDFIVISFKKPEGKGGEG